jgi:hypothetical protein
MHDASSTILLHPVNDTRDITEIVPTTICCTIIPSEMSEHLGFGDLGRGASHVEPTYIVV